MTHANKQRGEVKIDGPNGKQYKMCLTLGAIAQIEAELDIDSLTEIDTVMERARMKDVITIFVALLNGGGHEDLTRKDMMSWELDIPQLTGKISDCFKAAGFGEPEEGEDLSDGPLPADPNYAEEADPN